MLKLVDVVAGYGEKKVLKGISLSVEKGEIVTLIGANGSGKSTTFKAIMRQIPISDGTMELDGFSIDRKTTPDIVAMGMALVPEGRKIFPGLTVIENLKMGSYVRRLKAQELSSTIVKICELFPVLKRKEKQLGGTLSGGEQQILALARALMSAPKLILLDEPSMGLAPVMVEEIFEKIREINGKGTTILIVEQNAKMALSVATRGYIMENGSIVFHDSCANLMKNPKIMEAYLGG